MRGIQGASIPTRGAISLAVCCAVLLGGTEVPAGSGSAGRQPGGPIRIYAALDSTGVIPDAAGNAQFRSRGSERRFRVEVSGLPAGAYDLRVGEQPCGSIAVIASGAGALSFISTLFDDDEETPKEEGEEVIALTFDPRGQRGEVVQDGAVMLEALFPSRPSAGNRH